jgi:hypothetical protein
VVRGPRCPALGSLLGPALGSLLGPALGSLLGPALGPRCSARAARLGDRGAPRVDR